MKLNVNIDRDDLLPIMVEELKDAYFLSKSLDDIEVTSALDVVIEYYSTIKEIKEWANEKLQGANS
jgi:hypothetical protein